MAPTRHCDSTTPVSSTTTRRPPRRSPPDNPLGTDLSGFGPGAELQRLYAVQDGQLNPADGAGPARDCDQQLWRVVVAATPPAVMRYVDELLVLDADLTGSGHLYVGEVVPRGVARDATHWRLALAPNGATDLEVAVTVAHEIGHLLSLNAAQMTGQDVTSCPGLYLDTCCLDDAAYLLPYFDQTWTDAEFDAWNDANAEPDDVKRDTALEAFYDAHTSSFVDSYAATYPTEDFAESFAVWCAVGPGSPVLPEVIEGDPKNGAAKLAWFDEPDNPVGLVARTPCEQLRQLTR